MNQNYVFSVDKYISQNLINDVDKIENFGQSKAKINIEGRYKSEIIDTKELLIPNKT